MRAHRWRCVHQGAVQRQSWQVVERQCAIEEAGRAHLTGCVAICLHPSEAQREAPVPVLGQRRHRPMHQWHGQLAAVQCVWASQTSEFAPSGRSRGRNRRHGHDRCDQCQRGASGRIRGGRGGCGRRWWWQARPASRCRAHVAALVCVDQCHALSFRVVRFDAAAGRRGLDGLAKHRSRGNSITQHDVKAELGAL